MNYQDKPYFCILPWMHLYINPKGKLLPCCVANDKKPFPMVTDGSFEEIYNSESMNKLRQNMLNDIPSSVCEYCYKLEKYGSHSHRKHSNYRYFEPRLKDVVDNTKEDGSLSEINVLYFDIRFSNVCNYKCRMCGPLYSTKWYEDADLLGWRIKPTDNFVSIDNIKNFCHVNSQYLKSIKYIYFAGGEPLVQQQHYEFLEWCIENQIDAEIYYQSNGSVVKYGKYEIFDLWKKFKKVTFSVSIDGLGYMGEYIRSGFKTDTVDNNLTKICQFMGNNKEITVNCTFMAYNAFFATEFFDEMSTKDWVLISNVYTQLLIGPEYLQPKVLPKEIKEVAIEKIKTSKWFSLYPKKFEQLISNLQEDSTDMLWKQFVDYTKKIDDRRDQNILNFFPELKKYYD